MLQRAVVIGCPGSGKSTFARRLRDASGLPLYYLDMIWHRPDKTNCTQEEFDARLAEILTTPRWLIDGNYHRTLVPRLARCDTVFLFDLPAEDCLAGALSRIGRQREDLPWLEEQPDEEFLQYIRDFQRDKLPLVREMVEQYREGKTVVTFRTRREADGWLTENFPG